MASMQDLGRLLIIGGALLVITGVVVVLWHRVPFLEKLPGDISIHRDGVQLFFPIVTSIIISIVLTIVLNITLRLFR